MADEAPPSSHAAPPVIAPGHSFGSISDTISNIVLEKDKKRSRRWLIGFSISFALLMLFFYSVGMLLVKGIGIWGVNQPVAWGFAIINFVWWIGIGHAGTLISAVLLLLRQDWRTSINRFAEAMTLFAVACAGMYPILHLGRPWLFYWLFPYPNTMDLWPNFRSPLEFDVFAVSTYALVSLLFWYIGLVPDLATLRDRAKHKLSRILYGVGALGWRGSAKHWHHYETAYLLLAGLATSWLRLKLGRVSRLSARSSGPFIPTICWIKSSAISASANDLIRRLEQVRRGFDSREPKFVELPELRRACSCLE